MKKIYLFLLSFLCLVGCQNTTERLKIEGIVNIEYEELTQNLNSDVTFMLYIGRPDCGDCQVFYPMLEKYINENQETGLYYLDIKSLRDQANSKDATQEKKEFYENVYKELHFDWTPTLHIISNGKFTKTYQYLDEDYFKMKDREKQKERKQQFIDEFYQFMDDYFKEEGK